MSVEVVVLYPDTVTAIGVGGVPGVAVPVNQNTEPDRGCAVGEVVTTEEVNVVGEVV